MPINSCPTQVLPKATQSKNSAIQKTKNKNFGGGPSASEMNAVLALNSQGQTSEVETLARSLSVRFPLHGFGWRMLGTVLKLQGHVDEALQCLQKASKFSPRDPVGHNDLGVILKNQGRFSEAETSLRRALALNPYYAEAHGNLGNTLADQGQLAQAEASLRRALALKPDLAELHYNLGITLRDLGRFAEAESSLRQALVHKPDYAEAHSYLGGTLKDLGRLTESETSLRQSLALNPNYFAAHVNLALTLHDLNRLAESEASLRCALALKPHLAMSHRNLGNILISQDQLGKAMESFRCALAINADDVISHSNLLFCMSHDIFVDPQQLYAEHLVFGEQFEAPLRAGWPLHDNAKDPARCLQVGFVTGDLRGHPLTNFLEPVFKLLAKKITLTLHAYATQTLDDAVTDRMRNYFAHWHAVASLNDVDLTNKIHADGIDILIDLSGHTAHNRLLTFARKPAPIQASWLGYLGTTGLQAMDYYLCDPFWIPPGELDWQFTEKPAYLPAAVVFQPSELAPPVKTLPALANGYVTFGSFNRPNKLNASVIALWSMLLRNIPSAKLVLGAIPLASQNGLIQSFAHEGIEPNRLVFYQRSNLQDYLALHHQVDFCLDTYPYGGGATTAHAAWMGVPTLSLAGESPASRFGATEMHHLGLDGFIAASIEDFVAKGCYWAAHIAELAELRTTMRARFEASPLGQPQLFADNFEVLLRTMWQRWCSDLPSAQIEVEARLENTEKIEPSPQEMETLTGLYNNQRHDEAESLSRVLIRRFPTHGFAWKVLGAVLHAVGQLDESLEAKIRSVDLLPNDHEAHFNLAYEFHEQGRLNEAVKSYSLALAIEPNYAVAYCNLGNIFISMGLLPCAEAHCRQAIALNPGMANAHNNLGNALHAQEKYAQAEESYRFALELKPEWAEAYNNLAITLKDQGYRNDQIEFYRKALVLAPDWLTAHSNLLFYMSHDISVDPQQLHAEHLAFGKKFETPLRAGWQPHNNTKDPARCLQVGFVTGDLRDHALANFLEPVFKLLAKKTTLTLHAYATHTLDDAVTDRMRNYFAHWHAVASLSDVDLTNKIHADGIDILIDLSGHTAHNRLLTFARKPAPIQASWLGYLGTTGLQAMDYYLCDEFWVPHSELDWQFTEKPAYLPAAVVFQPSEFAPSVNPLPALANGFITFGSFNRHNKLNASVIVLWSMLLRDIPNARLVLGCIPLESKDILLQNFAQQGIEQGRIVFYPRTNLQDYLALHHQVDFCLDTYPYGGGATTAHAVWMGVPTLSLAGESPASRFGATMMHHLGLDGFITTSIDDFIAKGCYWAEHVTELAELRTTMRARFEASPLGQPQLFADNFDALLRTMWQRWCEDCVPNTLSSDIQQPNLVDSTDVCHEGQTTPLSDENSLLLGDVQPYETGAIQQEQDIARVIPTLIKMALDNEQLGQLLEASHLYLEILKIKPKHDQVNHNLGLLEAQLKGPSEALPRLKIAVQENPSCEKYWISYIYGLMQSGAVDAAASALELGQKYGLRSEIAEKMANDFVAALERMVENKSANKQTKNDICEDLPTPPSWPSQKLSLTANLDYIRQPGGISRRYVIYSPLYRHNSAGIRVLYELQKWLLCAGLDAIIIAATNSYQSNQFIDDIVIYPEVVFGNPLKAKRVVRYILNVPGKLSGDKEYAKNELLIAYNQELTCYSNGEILQVPSTESFFYNDGAAKTVNAVYVGKGQDLQLHPDDCIYITGTFPATRREVAQLLRSVKTLYLYDDFTMICHEAMLCGCAVQLISKDGSIGDSLETHVPSIQEFKAQLHDFIEITKLM